MRDQILELLGHRPFTPIRVSLSNGTTHVIRHPDQALVGPSYLIIGVPAHEAPGPDVAQTVFVSLLHVAQVAVQDATNIPQK